MNHDEIKSRLFEFWDRESELALTREISAHLKQCAECRRELDQWRRISKAAFSAEPIIPKGFADRVMARLPVRDHAAWLDWLQIPRWEWSTVLGIFVLTALYALLPQNAPQQEDITVDAILTSMSEDEDSRGWVENVLEENSFHE